MMSRITPTEETVAMESEGRSLRLLQEPLLADAPVGLGSRSTDGRKTRKLRHTHSAPRIEISGDRDIDGLKHMMEKYGSSFSFLLLVVIVLIACLSIGFACFYLLESHLRGTKTIAWIDVLYFCIVTMTTVGYGDLVPQTSIARIFTCAYVFLGFGLTAWLLSSAANIFLERQELILLNAIYHNRSGDADGINEVRKAKWKVAIAGMIFVALFGIGLIVLIELEGMSFVEAFYCICVTITTLGYGDLSFQTSTGRAFAIVWILLSTINVAQLYLYIAELYTVRKRRTFVRWVLSRKTTFSDLEAADMDNDRAVSAAEFVVFKLKEMGKIESQDVIEILKEFHAQDVDGSGTLSGYDLRLAG